jgi:hypothetical protein
MPLEGDEWKECDPSGETISLRPRTRAEQQAWIDDQYGRGKITRSQWRYQFDLLSLQKADGSFVEMT